MKTFYFLDGSTIETTEECRGCFLNNNRINKFLEPIYENERILVCQDMENPIPGFYIISTKQHINSILQMNDILIKDIASLIYIIRKGMADILNIEKTIFIQEEKNLNAHFHIWVLPLWNDENVQVINGNIKKYISSFDFNKTKYKILECNEQMRIYIKKFFKG